MGINVFQSYRSQEKKHQKIWGKEYINSKTKLIYSKDK